MKFSEQHPMNVAARCMLLEQVRKIDPLELMKVVPNFVMQYEEIEKEEVKIVYEIDWEYALFDSTNHELQKIYTIFVSQEVKPGKSEGEELLDKVIKESIDDTKK